MLLYDVSACAGDVSVGFAVFPIGWSLLLPFEKSRDCVNVRSTFNQWERSSSPSSTRNYMSTRKQQNTVQLTTIMKIAVLLFITIAGTGDLLRLQFPILVIKHASKVDDQVGATELNIKLEPKDVESWNFVGASIGSVEGWLWKKLGCFSIFLYDFESNFVCPAFLQFLCNVIYCKSAYENGYHCYLCSLYTSACLLWAIFFKKLQIWTKIWNSRLLNRIQANKWKSETKRLCTHVLETCVQSF